MLTIYSQSQTNKKLYLYKIRIDNDERVTKGGGGVPSVADNHFVDNLGGKYKLSLNSVVLHANGKWDAITNQDVRPKWKQNEVHRVRVRNNGSTRSKGTNTWKVVWLKGDDDEEQAQKGIKLADNFNPKRAKIYISLGEEDNLFGKKRDFFSILYNSNSINLTQFWKSQAMPTLCGPDKWHFYDDNILNPNPIPTQDAYFEVTPSMWVDPSNPSLLLDEIEIPALNVSFILRYEDY